MSMNQALLSICNSSKPRVTALRIALSRAEKGDSREPRHENNLREAHAALLVKLGKADRSDVPAVDSGEIGEEGP